VTCNAPPILAAKLQTVRYQYLDRTRIGPAIARINPDRRILAVPVRWRHFERRCESWTFDRRTWEIYRGRFDIVHFHLITNETDLIYAVGAETFELGHSSWRCNDLSGRRRERLHMQRIYMQYDKAIEAQVMPEPVKQESLPI
jgi:hypothetical protein